MSVIRLFVDHREGKIKEKFQSKYGETPDIQYENLVHGDFQIKVDDQVFFLFERKALPDLEASIKDGRYKNQKASLLSTFTTDQIFYIIEGNLKYQTDPKSASDKMINGSVINTILRDKIAIFQTKNQDETFELIDSCYKRVKSNLADYTTKEEKVVKRQIVTVTNGRIDSPTSCWKYQLCQVPEVSEKTADAIVETWSTSFAFYQDGLTSGTLTLKQKLGDVKTSDANGKKRKISSKAVESIISLMLPPVVENTT
jgi:ERCC4-type nuclease